jgi:two-component system LytT family response regulator
MTLIRTVIADDEPLARQKLALLLSADPGVQVVAECANARQTVEAIRKHKPAVLFLDVQMPDGDGFLVLERISPELAPVVIFTTAYDEYAIRAFEANALDYLLKPFDEPRLMKSLLRAKSHLITASRADTARQLLDSTSLGAEKTPEPERIVIKADGRIVFLNLSEIDWVEAASNYVRLHVGGASYLIRNTISETETKLDKHKFVRIHRSVIVNVDRIKELSPCNSGEFIVTLTNGKELSASRNYRENLEPLLIRTL